MLSAFVVILFLLSPQAVACDNAEMCRAQALIAHASQDFEAFHDYAWAAYRKGRAGDTEAMLLVARAQSLSGRPGDALVMLQRVAAQGRLPVEVATDPEFARVRALPKWNETASRLLSGEAEPRPASPEPPRPGPPKVEPPRAAETRPVEAKPLEAKPVETKPVETKPADPTPARPEATPRLVRDPGEPLKFTTTLTPSALAYDRASRRFIIADRRARRIAVIDENSGQVSTLVGALGRLSDVEGIAVDGQQGDLWVVTSGEEGPSLTKMQLISGRVLIAARLQDVTAPVVALTFVPAFGLVAADDEGVLWRVRGSGRAEKLVALEYVPKALGADAQGRLYVSAGGPRLGRFALGPIRKTGTVELDGTISRDGPFAIVSDRLLTILPVADGYEIRSSPIR